MVAVALGGFTLLTGRESGEVAGTSDDPSVAAQEEAKAAFDPLVPLENLKDATGKQSEPEFRFDKDKKVLAFVSQYNEANLTISQQKVPDNFRDNPSQLMSVANAFGADESMGTQKGTAYIATDEKTNEQTAIFATDEVLVFVRSTKVLDEEEWKFYINQLNPAR